jgi:hypothetical protein
MTKKEALSNLLNEASSFRSNLSQVEIRYCDKLKKMRAGQVCKVCGLFYFFTEDDQIEESGICQGCQDGFDMEQEEADFDFLMEQNKNLKNILEVKNE